MPDYDVIVVGAGPGGSTAARTCAHEGLRVAMLERHPEPGHKLCGGGLTSKVLKEFDIDRNVIECSVKKSHIFGEKKSITLKLAEEEATVYRSRFDNYLARQAVDNGSELLTSTFSKGVLREDGKIVGVVAESPKGFVKIRGKVIIAADGFDSITARSAGLLPRYDPSDVALTVQREAWTEREVHDDAVYVFVGKNVSPCGYGWIYPKSHGYTVGVGCLLSYLKGKLAQSLNFLISNHPIASKILSNTVKISQTQAACIPMTQSSKLCADNIMIIGDAAGQVDPIGGSGIYFAMKAGELAGEVASDAVSNEDFSRKTLVTYEDVWLRTHARWLRRRRRTLDKNADRFEEYLYSGARFQMLLESNAILRKVYSIGHRVLRSRLM